MECEQCGKQTDNKGTKPKRFCSDLCRKRTRRAEQADKRTDQADTIASGQEQTDRVELNDGRSVDTVSVMACSRRLARAASLEDYQAYGSDYAQRADAESLNWGEYMSKDQLKTAGLRGNRVTLPGDWDYEGVGA